MSDTDKTTADKPRRSAMHVIRTEVGGWLVRLAISVLPPGNSRDTLRMACQVWLKLLEVRIAELEGRSAENAGR